jgi:Chlorophyll A-B binding protein
MKAAVLASLVASAAAFAPSSMSPSRSTTTSVSGAMDSMEGSIDFRGKEFKFDPLKLSETFSPWLPWFKESELRHGRTAMLAVVGFIVPDFVRIPGDIYSFEHVPHPSDAHEIMIKDGPLTQLLLWVGLWELIVTGPACSAMMNGEREPGCTFLRIVTHHFVLLTDRFLARSSVLWIGRLTRLSFLLLVDNRLRLDVLRAQGRCRQEEDGRLRAAERTARHDCRRYVLRAVIGCLLLTCWMC